MAINVYNCTCVGSSKKLGMQKLRVPHHTQRVLVTFVYTFCPNLAMNIVLLSVGEETWIFPFGVFRWSKTKCVHARACIHCKHGKEWDSKRSGRKSFPRGKNNFKSVTDLSHKSNPIINSGDNRFPHTADNIPLLAQSFSLKHNFRACSPAA